MDGRHIAGGGEAPCPARCVAAGASGVPVARWAPQAPCWPGRDGFFRLGRHHQPVFTQHDEGGPLPPCSSGGGLVQRPLPTVAEAPSHRVASWAPARPTGLVSESGGPCRLPAQSHPCRGSPPTDAATPTGPWPALRGWTQSHAGYWSRGVPCDRGPRPAGAAGTPSCLLELPPWVASRPQPSMVTAATCPRHACPRNGHTGRRQRDRGFTARQGPGDRTVSGRGDPFFERASPSSPTGDRGNKVQTS